MGDGEGSKQDGRTLFRELLRYYPTAKVEDYHKMGRWLKDLIVMDTELVVAHRRECGSPEPPPAEEIDCPALPADSPSSYRQLPAPGATNGLRQSNGIPAAVPNSPSVRPAPPTITRSAPPKATTPAAPVSGLTSELKMIAAFVQKWDLDSTKTKLLLARLTPARRRTITENFKPAPGAASPTSALEKYIAQQEPSAAQPLRPSTPKAANPKAATTQKAPLLPGPVAQKRPVSGTASSPYTPAYGTASYSSAYSRAAVGASAPAVKRARVDGGSAPAVTTYGGRPVMGTTAARPSTAPAPAGGVPRPHGAVTRAKVASSGASAPAPAARKPMPVATKPGDLIKTLLGGL